MSQPPVADRKRLRPPRDYRSPGEQRRLLILVMTLGVVLLVMAEAAKPKNWTWLWGGRPQQIAATSPERPTNEYDTQQHPRLQRPLPPDTFISPRTSQAQTADKSATGSPARPFFSGVKPELLTGVKDHTEFDSTARERDAWFNLIAVLQNTQPKSLRAASEGPISFVQLYEQPQHYRGRLVTLRGIVKRAFDIGAPKNELGIEGYWQLWVFPAGGPVSPIVVYVLDLPEGFPTSRDPTSPTGFHNIHEPIEVTGFFFKNWAYSTGEKIYSAPLMVARTLDWRPPPPEQPATVDTSLLVYVVIGTAVLAVVLAALVYSSSKSRGSDGIERSEELPDASIRRLEETEPPKVGDVLRSLAEDDTSGDDAAPEPTEPPER